MLPNRYPILLPHSSARQNPRWSQIEELLFIPMSGMSPREAAIVNNAVAHGELYQGWMTIVDTCFQIEAELSNAGEDKLKLEFPLWVNHTLAATIAAEAAEKLE